MIIIINEQPPPGRTGKRKKIQHREMFTNTSRKLADDVLLSKARRMATRTRAGKACLICHESKSKCSEYRPCKRCIDRQIECVDFRAKTGFSSNGFNTESQQTTNTFNHIVPSATSSLDSSILRDDFRRVGSFQACSRKVVGHNIYIFSYYSHDSRVIVAIFGFSRKLIEFKITSRVYKIAQSCKNHHCFHVLKSI